MKLKQTSIISENSSLKRVEKTMNKKAFPTASAALIDNFQKGSCRLPNFDSLLSLKTDNFVAYIKRYYAQNTHLRRAKHC